MKPIAEYDIRVRLPRYFEPVSTWLPVGKKGNVEIERFRVSEKESLESLVWGDQYVPQGEYTRLLIDGWTQMTDGPIEQAHSVEAVDNARGDVLILGLGLGMIVPAIC